MEFQYKLNQEDWVETLNFINNNISNLSKYNSFFSIYAFTEWFIIAISLVLLYDFTKNINYSCSIYLMYGLGFSGVIFVFLSLGKLLRQKFSMKNLCSEDGIMCSELKMTLNEEGIATESQFGQSIYFWPAVQDMKLSKNLICIFYDNCLVFSIPKRIFRDIEEQKEFLSYIDNRRTLKN